MDELMKLLDENLICTDIEIQLTLERTYLSLTNPLMDLPNGYPLVGKRSLLRTIVRDREK